MSIRMGLNWVFLSFVGRGNVRLGLFSLFSGIILLILYRLGEYGGVHGVMLCCVNTVGGGIIDHSFNICLLVGWIQTP